MAWKMCFVLVVVATLLNNQVLGKAIKPVKYLEKFGYYTEPSTTSNVFSMKGLNKMSNSIKQFQRFAGIKETGIIDNATIIKMKTPRCGMKDIKATKQANSVLFNSVPNKWAKYDLTYYIETYTKDLSKKSVNKILQQAFKHWEKVTPLQFKKKQDISADILIKFATDEHGDGYKFDGPGQTLAHAFPPSNGDTHFDDAEMFTDGVGRGINLLWVAVHEFGHALGLSHSHVNSSVMYPFYGGFVKDLKLHNDDVTKIQNIYGKPGSRTTKRPSTTTKKRCYDTYHEMLCKSWKRGNYCKTNYRVKTGCPKTCNLC